MVKDSLIEHYELREKLMRFLETEASKTEAGVALAVLLEVSFLFAIELYGQETAMEKLSVAINTYAGMYANQ